MLVSQPTGWIILKEQIQAGQTERALCSTLFFTAHQREVSAADAGKHISPGTQQDGEGWPTLMQGWQSTRQGIKGWEKDKSFAVKTTCCWSAELCRNLASKSQSPQEGDVLPKPCVYRHLLFAHSSSEHPTWDLLMWSLEGLPSLCKEVGEKWPSSK